jgi:hypothetical protein
VLFASILLSWPHVFCTYGIRAHFWLRGSNRQVEGPSFLIDPITIYRQVEGPSFLFDTITVFPESGFEELQLTMEAFLSQRVLAVCTNIERMAFMLEE